MNVQVICERWNALHARISSILIAVRSAAADCRCSCLPGLGHRCESCASSRSTRFTCFAMRNHCRSLKSGCWQRCSISEPAPTRLSITRIFAGTSVVKRCNCLKKLESVRTWSNTCEDSGIWRAGVPCPAKIIGNSKKWVCTVKPSCGFRLEWWPRQPTAAIASTRESCATYCDADLNILFRIVMQCQIIDDVLDYAKDMSAGLPSFLTASKSLPQAFGTNSAGGTWLCRRARIAAKWRCVRARLALFLVSTCAKLVIVLGRWRQRPHVGQQFAQCVHGPRLPAAEGDSSTVMQLR